MSKIKTILGDAIRHTVLIGAIIGAIEVSPGAQHMRAYRETYKILETRDVEVSQESWGRVYEHAGARPTGWAGFDLDTSQLKRFISDSKVK